MEYIVVSMGPYDRIITIILYGLAALLALSIPLWVK